MLFTAPKHFRFRAPCRTLWTEGDIITITAHAFAKSAKIECDTNDLNLSDNQFDVNAGSGMAKFLSGTPGMLHTRFVYDIR